MSDFATTEAAFVGNQVSLFRRSELWGAWCVAGSVATLREIVDLGREVVYGNV